MVNGDTEDYQTLATYEMGNWGENAALLVSGEIDVATVLTFRDALAAVITTAHSPAVVDLSRVTFIDASGISALVAARQAVTDTDVTLVLLDPSTPVRRLLEVVGLDEHFDIVSSDGERR
jgi:anti-sigma B factor antagonist